jgi:hypothetical protein
MSIVDKELNNKIPDSVVAMVSYNLYRRDRDYNADTQKNGGIAVYLRQNLEVIRVIWETEFEMISIILILQTGHKMLVIGAYRRPRFSYDETDFFN